MRAVSTAEPLAPSRRLRSAAEAERARLGRELGRLDERISTLTGELAALESRRTEIREQLALLARLTWQPDDSAFATSAGSASGVHLQAVEDDGPPVKVILRGADIRVTAVLLLASSPEPNRPIHYQQWYRLLREAGYGLEARDPLGTFLTQITRSPVVRRVGAPGVYALDLGAPDRLRARLRELETKLARGQIEGEEPDDVARGREERAGVVRELRRVERQLEEALRSLGALSAAARASA
jgi:hypothetical protein